MMVDQREVRLYICRRSLRCWLTRRLLERRGYHFEVIDTTGDAQLCSWLKHFTGRKTMPYDLREAPSSGIMLAVERVTRWAP